MYKLYYAPGGANMAAHAALIETKASYELIKLDLDAGQQRKPEYLKLNPHARVPTLIYDQGKVLYESVAICQFLAERHPEAGLTPKPGADDRAQYLQWSAYLTNTLQDALMQYWHADYSAESETARAEIKKVAERRVGEMFAFIDKHLAANGPHLCGANLYVCDYFLGMLARWTRLMAKPAITQPNIRKLVAACLARPAYRRMLEEEGIEQAI